MRLRFATAGESPGRGLVALVEGLPAGLPVAAEQVDRELVRRMQGYGRGARMKIERDRIEWISGVRAGETLSGISRHYGVSLSSLSRANCLTTRSKVRIGQKLRLPG